jgi:hypothetical protein
MSVIDRPKAEIVSRVLERIAEDRYRAGEEEDGDGGDHHSGLRANIP